MAIKIQLDSGHVSIWRFFIKHRDDAAALPRDNHQWWSKDEANRVKKKLIDRLLRTISDTQTLNGEISTHRTTFQRDVDG
jgi:hypothetical protein